MVDDVTIKPPEAASDELSMDEAVAALVGDGGDQAAEASDATDGQPQEETGRQRDEKGRFAKRESEAGDGGSEGAGDQPEESEAFKGDIVLGGLEASDDGAAGSEEETFMVRVNGSDMEVSRDELLAGYSRDADYRRKTQALAEERRALETEREQLQARLQQQQQSVGSYAELVQTIGPEPQIPVEADFGDDEYGFMQAMTRYTARKQQWDAAKGQYDQQLANQAQEAQAQQQAYLQSEYEKLVEKWPDMGDEVKAEKIGTSLKSFLRSQYGFTPEELTALTDHRTVLMVRDAYAYRNARKGREKAQEAIQGKPKVTRPSARRDASDEQAERRDKLLNKRPGGELTLGEATSLYTGDV